MIEDTAPNVISILTHEARAGLHWRRCAKCGSVSYAPPGSQCGLLRVEKRAGGQQGSPAAEPCGGDLSQPPGWQTQLAPATADEAWLSLAARFARSGRIADAIGCLARATQTAEVVAWRERLARQGVTL